MINETIKIAALNLKVVLHDTATPEQAMAVVNSICGAIDKQDASIEGLRLLLGKTMVQIQERRLYNPTYRTFEAFTSAVMEQHRLSRATVRDAMMIAKRLPSITTGDVEAMPMVNLSLAARAAKNARPEDIDSLIADAKKMGIAKFRESVERRGLVVVPSPTPNANVTLRITVPASIAARWKELVGDRNPGEVFAALLPAQKAAPVARAARKTTATKTAGAAA